MEWLLGILANCVTIIDGLAKLFGRNRPPIQALEANPRCLIDEPATSQPPSHATEVAQRLTQLIDLLRQCYSDLTLAELAEYLGHDDVGILEGLLRADSPPRLSVLEDIAEKLGVSPNWLKTGKYAPYSNHAPSEHDPRDYMKHIQAEQPLAVYLIRSNCETAYVLIAFKFSKYKFKIFNTILHVSSHVGNTGQRQLYEFYEFIRTIRDKHSYGQGFGTHVYGRTLSDDKFDTLSDGSAFPGTIIEKQSYNCNWWDDLTDINYEYPIGRDRYEGYGQPFVEAQSIIREHIKYWGAAAE